MSYAELKERINKRTAEGKKWDEVEGKMSLVYNDQVMETRYFKNRKQREDDLNYLTQEVVNYPHRDNLYITIKLK